MKVIIDSGHGGSETGATAFGVKEKDLNIIFSKALANKLAAMSIEVDRSLINDINYSSVELTNRIKNSGASLCISCHNNAFNGKAQGFEVIHSINSDGKLAKTIVEEVKKTGFLVRRIFSRESMAHENKGKDFYYVIRLTYPKVVTIIVEFGFIDNIEDLKRLRDPVWQDKLCSAVANGVKFYLDGKKPQKTSIRGEPLLKEDQLKRAFKSKNPNSNTSIVDIYYAISKVYNIKADLAFLQAMHETNWLKFSGTVKPDQNNFAGLGSTGPDNPGEKYNSMEEGVEAHIQHLFAYCCKDPIPKGRIMYDTRFQLVSRGIAPNWEDLNGRWAVPGAGYGENIVAMQRNISSLYPPNIPEDNIPDKKEHWAKKSNDELLEAGIILNDHTDTLDNYATEGMVIAIANNLRKEMEKK